MPLTNAEKKWKEAVEELKECIAGVLYGGKTDMSKFFTAVTNFSKVGTTYEAILEKSIASKNAVQAYSKLFGNDSDDLLNKDDNVNLGERLTNLNQALDKVLEELDSKDKNEERGRTVIKIHGNNNMIGNGNQIDSNNISVKIEGMTLDELKYHLDNLDETEQKSFIQKIAEHPLFVSILGGLTGGVI